MRRRRREMRSIVAILTARRSEVTGISDVFIEYLYIALCLWLGAYGAGPISLDFLFAKKFEAGERPIDIREGALVR